SGLSTRPKAGRALASRSDGAPPRQPFQDDIRRGGPMLERRGTPEQLIPLLREQWQVHRGTQERVERTVRGRPTHLVPLLSLQVFQARQALKPQQSTEPQQLCGTSRGVRLVGCGPPDGG